MRSSGNLLVVYALATYPLRATIRDHLLSFRRYSPRRVVYLNLALHGVPRGLERLRFDAIIFHTNFVGRRWNPKTFERVRARAQPLKALEGVRVVLPQDEFIHTDSLSDFIEEFEVDVIGTVAPNSQWSRIYPKVDRQRVRFVKLLTGYLDDDSTRRMIRFGKESKRKIDVGYRAPAPRPWLGRHGMLKSDLAATFGRVANNSQLRLDISTRSEDVLLGDDWYRFLAACRYTLGAEGGASILDASGAVRASVEAYARENASAPFDEIEAACFPGRDGELALRALSPRHLEACATGTCQILVEGNYDGVLRPGEHYIPLSRDLSNLDVVVEQVLSGERRESLVEAAFEEVVASARYTYRRFVEDVEEAALGPARKPVESEPARPRVFLGYFRGRDRILWIEMIAIARTARLLRAAARQLLPRPLYEACERLWRRRRTTVGF